MRNPYAPKPVQGDDVAGTFTVQRDGIGSFQYQSGDPNAQSGVPAKTVAILVMAAAALILAGWVGGARFGLRS